MFSYNKAKILRKLSSFKKIDVNNLNDELYTMSSNFPLIILFKKADSNSLCLLFSEIDLRKFFQKKKKKTTTQKQDVYILFKLIRF